MAEGCGTNGTEETGLPAHLRGKVAQLNKSYGHAYFWGGCPNILTYRYASYICCEGLGCRPVLYPTISSPLNSHRFCCLPQILLVSPTSAPH